MGFMREEILVGSSFGYFESVVSPVACFAFGHRTVHTQHLHKMDVAFRRLLRRLVGLHGGVDWSLPWRQLFHSWNERVRQCCQRFAIVGSNMFRNGIS